MNHFMSLAEGWRNFRNSSAAQPADASAVFVVGGNLDISLSSALQLADQAGGDLIKVYEIDSLRIFSSCECCIALPLAEVEIMPIVPMTDNPDRADLAAMFRTDGKLFPKPGVSCAEQPASKPSKKKSQASCAEQPANEPSKKKSRRADGLTSIRSPVVLNRAPLFDELLEVLDAEKDGAGVLLFDEIVRTYMFDRLKPTSVRDAVENCFHACSVVRQKHFCRLLQNSDDRASDGWRGLKGIEFTTDDMKIVMNDWRNCPEMWMHEDNLRLLGSKRRQEQHALKKSKFSTYLFELIGNKDLVDLFIRVPIASAEQPAAALRSFMAKWEEHRQSPAHQRAVQKSQQKGAGHKRISQQIWEAKRQLDQAERLSRQVEDATLDFFKLDKSSQALVEDFQTGALKKRLFNVLDARFEKLLADRE